MGATMASITEASALTRTRPRYPRAGVVGWGSLLLALVVLVVGVVGVFASVLPPFALVPAIAWVVIAFLTLRQ